MNAGKEHFKDRTIISICGIVIAGLLMFLAYLHHYGTEESEREEVFFYVSMAIGFIHLVYFIWRYLKDKKMGKQLGEM